MPFNPSLTITIHPSMSNLSSVIGLARVKIDDRILLKEIPVLHWEGSYAILMEARPVAICPPELDMEMLQEVVWSLREVIELAVVEEVKKV
jgi:hypothetical protein